MTHIRLLGIIGEAASHTVSPCFQAFQDLLEVGAQVYVNVFFAPGGRVAAGYDKG
jgi:hypothetical protein